MAKAPLPGAFLGPPGFGYLAGMSFSSVVNLVEQVLRKIGIDPVASKVRGDADTVAWGMKRGSAQVLFIVSDDPKTGTWVRAIAPVVKLPAEPKRLELYGRLLDLNAKAMRNAAFGVLGDNVVVVSERPGQGLDAGEAEQMLKHVGATADHYDDLLADELGLERV